MGTMTPHRKRIAQIKLRGKKSSGTLSCGCCSIENRKENLLECLNEKEMKAELETIDAEGDDIA